MGTNWPVLAQGKLVTASMYSMTEALVRMHAHAMHGMEQPKCGFDHGMHDLCRGVALNIACMAYGSAESMQMLGVKQDAARMCRLHPSNSCKLCSLADQDTCPDCLHMHMHFRLQHAHLGGRI